MSDLIFVCVSNISKVINRALGIYIYIVHFQLEVEFHCHKYVFPYLFPFRGHPLSRAINQLWKLARVAGIAKENPRDHIPPDGKRNFRDDLFAIENFFSGVRDDVNQHRSERRLLAHRELRQRECRRQIQDRRCSNCRNRSPQTLHPNAIILNKNPRGRLQRLQNNSHNGTTTDFPHG
jgi:hypothetical protein